MIGAVNERYRRLRKKTQLHTLMIGVVADIIAWMVIVPVRTALSLFRTGLFFYNKYLPSKYFSSVGIYVRSSAGHCQDIGQENLFLDSHNSISLHHTPNRLLESSKYHPAVS